MAKDRWQRLKTRSLPITRIVSPLVKCFQTSSLKSFIVGCYEHPEAPASIQTRRFMKPIAHETMEEVHRRRLEALELDSGKAEAEALEASLTALREDRLNPEAYIAAAKCHRKLGQFEQAIAVLQQ